MTTPEDRDLWERDEEALRTPAPADPMRSEAARVARWEYLVQNTARWWPRQKAEAAMRLADEEHAALVAERDALRGALNVVDGDDSDDAILLAYTKQRARAEAAESERAENLESQLEDWKSRVGILEAHDAATMEWKRRALDRLRREQLRAKAAEAEAERLNGVVALMVRSSIPRICCLDAPGGSTCADRLDRSGA